MIRKDVSPSLEKGGKRMAKLETKVTMKSSPTTTAKFEDQKFQKFQNDKKWYPTKFGKRRKKNKEVRKKNNNNEKSSKNDSNFWRTKNSKPSKRWELTFQQVWKVGVKESWTYDQ